jgi:hypothetical protein
LLDISLLENKNFLVTLDSNHPNYQTIFLTVKSLLGAVEKDDNSWSMSYDDLKILKQKLNQANIVDERWVDEDAYKWINYLLSIEDRNDRIKAGEFNEEMKGLLGGKIKFVPYEDQYPAIAYIYYNKRCGLFDSMGSGKAQPLYSKILTPIGWKKMGDMKVGDKVINDLGRTSRVTGVFPQGKKSVYEVVFGDGSRTRCCDDHLWLVNSSLRNIRGSLPRVKALSEIKETLAQGPRHTKFMHFIPMVKPVVFKEKDLPMHPYLLGALLGDGYFGEYLHFSSADTDLVEKLRELIPIGMKISPVGGQDTYGYRITRGGISGKNQLLEILRDLGLSGKRSQDKFIPDIYLYSSKQSRLELLRGLMDTDGGLSSFSTSVNVHFSSSSPELTQGLVFLVQSFGGTATVYNLTKNRYTYKGELRIGRDSYRVSVKMPKGFNPFWLSRKASLWKPCSKFKPSRSIREVNYIGEEEVQCISVNSRSQLYVTDDCIVTHNTLEVLAASSIIPDIEKVLVIVPNTPLLDFTKQITKHTYFRPAPIPQGKANALQYAKAAESSGNFDVMLVHPENLVQTKSNSPCNELCNLLMDMKWDLIIITRHTE